LADFWQGRTTLHGQAYSRLLIVALVSAIAISLVAANNYRNQRERELLQKRSSMQSFYVKELQRVEERWLTESAQVKDRIEFSRILEGDESVRWSTLSASLNAQSEFTHFSNFLILNRENQIVFRYGSEAQKMQSNPALLTSSWYYAEDVRELYRVYRQPIWLGKVGQGSLILLKTLSNAELDNLATPETYLHLYFYDQVLASSNGNPWRDETKRLSHSGQDTVLTSVSDVIEAGNTALIQSDILWPGDGAQPVLLVQRELQAAYPLNEFLLRPLMAVLLINVLIWLGLGRWLSHTVKRIESLKAGTTEYANTGKVVLASARFMGVVNKQDEISDLAKSMDTLMHDIEVRNREQKAYLETLAMLEEAVIEMNCDGLILRASAGWTKLSHYENPLGKVFHDFIFPEDRAALQAHCGLLLSGEKNYAVMRLRLNVESSVNVPWLECRFVTFCDESGVILGVRGVLRDITQTYLYEKQITHMALHDALTGLPNRVLLEDRIKISLRQASRTHQQVAICFIDMDHFKNVNDSLGHSAGDKLLLAFAERLGKQLRVGDTVARWGGDEFVVLLPDMDSEQDIRDVTQKMNDSMRAPLLVEGAELVATFSMGVAIYPDDGAETESLFSEADRAMFFAKAQGRNQVCFFRDMTSKGIGKKELYIQNRLASAIAANQIQAWFQPVIAADSGRCAGVEVLARWHDEEHGWISPATFIPMAENLGLINEVGQQILTSSLEAARRWRDAGFELHLAINVSRRQLFTTRFTERLLDEVKKYQIAPATLILEITESVAHLDAGHAFDRLQELKAAGFQLAIDDFGTGYSSLSQLHEMHVDELKVDISFVRRLQEKSGLSMTQAIINLARALNLKTVAEGVETQEAAVLLKQLGVDYFQGYYFAKPMPLVEFEAWYQEQLQHKVDSWEI
jgi:diguanylate cyclase (GGDEF)-like protein